MKKIIPLFFLLLICFSCNQQIKEKVDFIEARITRYAVLERARETIVLRKIDKDWNAIILGDGLFGSCQYQRIGKSKSSLEDLWKKLVDEGLLEIPDGKFRSDCCTDGHGYEVEILHQDKLKRFSFHIPEQIDSKEAKQIQSIGNLLSNEFEIPMFYADYSRKDIGDYLIKSCESNQNKQN